MAHSNAIRSAARAAFVHEGLPLIKISERLGIPMPTLRNWKKSALARGDDWERAALAVGVGAAGAAAATEAVIGRFMRQFQVLMGEIEEAGIEVSDKIKYMALLTDSYVKMTAAVARSQPKLDKLSVALEVLSLLSDYVVRHEREEAPRLVAALESFGPELAARYG